MTTRIARWGNSLGIRIPKSVAHNAQIEEGDSVELTVRNGTIVVRPARPRYSLELVGRITPRNRHRETDWGGPTGHETWQRPMGL
jgi:antitoxin MazE